MNKKEKKELALSKILLVAAGVVGLGVVVWLAWARPTHRQLAAVNSFASCKAAGYPVQESYPEVCVTSDGTPYANPAQKAPAAPAPVEDSPLKAQTASKYLTISEWGVRFKLETSNEDAYYLIKSSLPTVAYVSLVSLQTTNCKADGVSTGAISRFTAADTDPDRNDKPLTELFPNATKVGTYYYSFQGPQAACSDEQAVQAKADAARQAFSAAMKLIETIPGQ